MCSGGLTVELSVSGFYDFLQWGDVALSIDREAQIPSLSIVVIVGHTSTFSHGPA